VRVVRGLVSTSWRFWIESSAYVREFQSRLLLTTLYFSLLAPFGILVRVIRRPIYGGTRPVPAWSPRRMEQADIDSVRRQF